METLIQEEYVNLLDGLQRKLEYYNRRLVEMEKVLDGANKKLEQIDKYLACL